MQHLPPTTQVILSNPAGQLQHPPIEQRFAVQYFQNLFPLPGECSGIHLLFGQSLHQADTKANGRFLTPAQGSFHPLPWLQHSPQGIGNQVEIDRFHGAIEDHFRQHMVLQIGAFPLQIGRILKQILLT
jgi:hypothetical protein